MIDHVPCYDKLCHISDYLCLGKCAHKTQEPRNSYPSIIVPISIITSCSIVVFSNFFQHSSKMSSFNNHTNFLSHLQSTTYNHFGVNSKTHTFFLLLSAILIDSLHDLFIFSKEIIITALL